MNVAIIGAGPCGIMSALEIKKLHPDYQVTLFEKNEEIGSRIKVSGNGKCNFFNANIESKYYNVNIDYCLKYKDELFSFFDEAGLAYFYDDEGRYYPRSESSQTIIYILKRLLNKYKVQLKTSSQVKSISSDLVINGIKFDKVICAIGGVSYNNDLLNYKIISKEIGVNSTKLTPSLAPLSTSKFNPKMEGKRIKCKVSLKKNNLIIKEEEGEVIFKKDGISGIVIFNMSSFLARTHCDDLSSYKLSLDLLPSISDDELKNLMKKDPSLNNILLKEIADEVISRGKDYFNTIRNFELSLRGIYEFKFSQVTSGGVQLNLLNDNLSLKSNPNIFVGGEFLDIDGECGGFNIGFAFLSGLFIANNI